MMIMNEQIPTPDDLQRDDDAGMAALLREVGAGDRPAPHVADEIRAQVHAEWRAVVAERTRRKRFVNFGVAAGVLGVAASALLAWRMTDIEPVVLVAQVNGKVELTGSDGRSRALRNGDRVVAGDRMQSAADSHIAFDFGSGVTARIDGDSKLELNRNGHLFLSFGAVYVDAVPNREHADELVLDTAFGSVRHLGTQYQVRIVKDGIEVGVREGRVEVTHSRGTHSGVAGELMRLSSGGDVVRSPLSAFDPRWEWAMNSAPTFNIADRSLLEFLNWLAREMGRRLVFDSPQAQQVAAAIRLRGSIEGLDLNTALTAVLSTTQLRRTQPKDESLHIALSSTIESDSGGRPTP